MLTVGVRELKARLSHYLEAVSAGEEVEVQSRGKTVARLVGVSETFDPSDEEVFAALVAEGLVEPPSVAKGAKARSKSALVSSRGRAPSELVREQRR
ncbi:MAG: type II toxin-antitoxin system prevent-host-death family antitoxin [Deltaproteobacteria bacterium]|nr:type II toxin-antitoxin system prevent-host-death family antitoxin [Deltaproteobacteria bacterium]